MKITRTAYRSIAFCCGAAILLLLHHNINTLYSAPLLSTPFTDIVLQPTLKVAVLETKGCHDEVSSSFLSAFGHMDDVRVHAYLKERRFGIDALFDELPGRHRRHVAGLDEFEPYKVQNFNPDIVLTVTSEYDIRASEAILTFETLFHNTSATLFCVIHHPSEIEIEGMFNRYKPWMEAKRIRFITLSEHVSKYLRDAILRGHWAEWMDSEDIPVSTFPPVFVVKDIDMNNTISEGQRQRFALQGDLVVVRSPNRDYSGTFEKYGEMLERSKDADFELYVLGDGALPEVPEAAKDSVHFETGLPYVEFYRLLHSATALLPAFASDEYTRVKASSTVPASLIAGSPLIADRQLLLAYTYLDEEDVYLREEGEDEVDAMARICRLPQAERHGKAERLLAKNAEMAMEASSVMRGWMFESMRVAAPTD